ncbi:MAG: 50S ribosomal protein L29, partial [Firmicutes bacterium]|nr:50S ribosomal protein L29 [Bacillota bacterium]
MKLSEIREMNVTELNEKVYALKEELFNLRRKQAVGQLKKG